HAREGTDLRVARHQPDERRRESHSAERDEKRVLAAHQVADATEYERAKRTDQEPRGERADILDEVRPGLTLREELRSEESGEAAEDVEVVPLDHVSDGCGDDDSAQFLHGERRSGHNSLWSVVEVPVSRPNGTLSRWRAT